jgi:hypothetical protein
MTIKHIKTIESIYEKAATKTGQSVLSKAVFIFLFIRLFHMYSIELNTPERDHTIINSQKLDWLPDHL